MVLPGINKQNIHTLVKKIFKNFVLTLIGCVLCNNPINTSSQEEKPDFEIKVATLSDG